jgi:hypothetical protein
LLSLLLILVLAGWLHMGALLLSVLFSYFIITKLNFMKPRGNGWRWPSFWCCWPGLAYALTYFIHETVRALPKIADRAVPAIIAMGHRPSNQASVHRSGQLEGQGLRVRAQPGEQSGRISRTSRAGPPRSLCICLSVAWWPLDCSQSAAGTGTRPPCAQ